ncbi:MAG TPA: [NiFe]-hydrogenase assembly chaperone HybE [Hydrogenophaga sp.]
MQAPESPSATLLTQRVAALTDHFCRVQHERMAGVALLNPALAVAAVGFEWGDAQRGGEPDVAEGVLITPWFMSLVRLPARVLPLRHLTGVKFVRDFGSERFDFIGAHDLAVGYHETCALFSPMQGFDHQERALETAREVLALTRPPPTLSTPPEPTEAVPAAQPLPSRRAFFLPGRQAQPGAGQ